jgi:hypothetical protein
MDVSYNPFDNELLECFVNVLLHVAEIRIKLFLVNKTLNFCIKTYSLSIRYNLQSSFLSEVVRESLRAICLIQVYRAPFCSEE